MYKTLFVVGPTASGKSFLAVELAKKYGGEVVSADSMQIYRRMDIGTAKPTALEMQGIAHHLIDVCDIERKFSVAEYAELAKSAIASISEKGKLPIVAGGTGLYIDAVLNNTVFADHEDDPTVREDLKKQLAENGKEWLYGYLENIDPIAAKALHPNDTKRVMRAIERYLLCGKTKTQTDMDSHSGGAFCDPLVIGITFSDRNKLYDRINERVDDMFAHGLVNEVKGLIDDGLMTSDTARQAIGYKEIAEYISGKCTEEEAKEKLKLGTRHYAKRQLTWFRKNNSIKWICFDTDAGEDKSKLVDIASEYVYEFLKK